MTYGLGRLERQVQAPGLMRAPSQDRLGGRGRSRSAVWVERHTRPTPIPYSTAQARVHGLDTWFLQWVLCVKPLPGGNAHGPALPGH